MTWHIENHCNCNLPTTGDGWFTCARHRCKKHPRWVQLCRTREDYFRAWEAGRGPGQATPLAAEPLVPGWDVSQPSRGLGDTVAKITHASGLGYTVAKVMHAIGFKTPCGGCSDRQDLLNRWLPYKRKKGATKIRVGLLTPTLLFGGAERWVAALAVGLDPAKVCVVGVAVRDRDQIFPAIGETIRRSRACTIAQGPGSFIGLAKQCDVLIVWGVHDLSMLAGYSGRVVMVGHGHCDWTVRAIRACLPYVTDYAAVSRHAAESFCEAGIDRARVAIVHNGIDTHRCEPGRSRDEVRAEWGVLPGEIAVGHVGRLSAEKNPLAVVRAVEALGPGYRAVIVGGGLPENREIEAARQSVPGLIYRAAVENVGDIYRALDCFVLATRSEGFSLAMTEAWYCGCPTVATPVGAVELQELYGDLCVSVPVGATAGQLAAAVRRAIAPENLPTVLRASRVVAQHYTAAVMCKRWETYLERVMGRN